jgi:hypothetical protein
MLFVDTSIIHYSSEGVLILCNILDLLIYSLLDEKLDSDATVDASILANVELMDFIKMYNSLPVDDKSAIRQIVISLHEKNKAEPN